MKPYSHLIIIVLVALLGLFQYGLGQSATGAHEDYLHHSYQEAIRKYLGKVNQHPDDAGILFNLANSYRLSGQMKEAENWFARALQHSDDSRAWLYYAQVLLSNRKYAQAKEAFIGYAGQAVSETDAANARKIAAACDKLAKEGAQPTGVHVQKADFNSDKLDFSPTFWRAGTLVFASNRPGTTGPDDAPDPWTEDRFVDLWVVDIAANGKAGTPTPLAKEINTRYHEGPMAFNAGGDKMYFTRSDLQGGTRRGYDDKNNTRLKIYCANWVNEKWGAESELPFNSSKFSSCHPTISPNEDSLVFASDRPGGYGGMDLWLSIHSDGGWSEPHNLGPDINTAGNELFPSLHADGSLYFSSDFMAGYGGLDIFRAGRRGEEWGQPENMGSPINSSLDDFGITVSADRKNGHFSSNRGGQGDDIYSFLDMASLTLEVHLRDCRSGNPLPHAQVMVEGQGNRVLEADEQGIVRIPAAAGADYTLQAYGKGLYADGDCDGKASVHIPSKGNELLPTVTLRLSQANPCCISLSDPDTGSNSQFQYQWRTGDGQVVQGRSVTHCYNADGHYEAVLEIVDADFAHNIEKYTKAVTVTGCGFQPQAPLVVEGVVRDKLLGTPLPHAEVKLVDKCTGKAHVVLSDSAGRYQFVLGDAVNCDHWLMSKKDGFAPQNSLLPLKGRPTDQPLLQDVDLDPTAGIAQGMPYPQGPAAAQPQYPYAAMLPPLPAGYIYVTPINYMAAPQPGTMLSEANFQKPIGTGDVIELYNIYFDFDKSAIRQDAEADLWFLLSLMRKYPSMRGEISAHTDCRSSDLYNLKLSQDRAQSALAWLVARGVDPRRLTVQGYGEFHLRNQCADGVLCDENEHQRNRRVEFRVTYFDGVINSKEYASFLPLGETATR